MNRGFLLDQKFNVHINDFKLISIIYCKATYIIFKISQSSEIKKFLGSLLNTFEVINIFWVQLDLYVTHLPIFPPIHFLSNLTSLPLPSFSFSRSRSLSHTHTHFEWRIFVIVGLKLHTVSYWIPCYEVRNLVFVALKLHSVSYWIPCYVVGNFVFVALHF